MGNPHPSEGPIPVYLAGPDVFLPDAADVGRTKQSICARHGLDGRYPLDAPIPADLGALPAPEVGRAYFEACVTMMEDCAAGLANLTPFRGPSADVGTTFELGYLLGRGRPVFGYTSEPAHYQERIPPDGLFVEPFELADNLMLEGAVMRSGSRIVRIEEPGRPLPALEAFERCVVLAAATLGAG